MVWGLHAKCYFRWEVNFSHTETGVYAYRFLKTRYSLLLTKKCVNHRKSEFGASILDLDTTCALNAWNNTIHSPKNNRPKAFDWYILTAHLNMGNRSKRDSDLLNHNLEIRGTVGHFKNNYSCLSSKLTNYSTLIYGTILWEKICRIATQKHQESILS